MKYDIIGMGLVAVDHIFLNDKKGKKNGPSYLGSAGGGSVGNTLSFLGTLGFKTAIIGAIGSDIQSEIIKQDFKTFGVNTNWLIQKGGLKNLKRSRQYFHIISDPRHSHKFALNCPSCEVPSEKQVILIKKDILKKEDIIESTKKCQILHIDRANDTSISLARVAINSGGMVSFDFSFDSYENTRSKSQELISVSTIVKANSKTFKAFLKRNDLNLDEFIYHYPNIRLLIITDSEKGIKGFIRGQKGDFKKYTYSAISCSRLSDTAGAGDILIGSIIAQLISKTTKLEVGYEEKMLAISQGLASLNCCFYGARSYSRILSTKKVSPIDIFSIGFDTANSGKSSSTLPPNFGIPEPFQFPYRFTAYGICSICGASKSKGSKKKKSRKKNGLGEKLANAQYPMIQSYNLARNSKDILNIQSKPMVFIGSGSSFSAGIFGEQIIFSLLGNPAMTMAPFELRTNTTPLNKILPFLISYGGKNPDILYAFDRLKALGVKEGAVITGNPDSELARKAEDQGWKIYQVSKQIDGFVASTGYLTTLSSMSGILAPHFLKKDLDNFFELKNLIGIFKKADLNARIHCEKLGGSSPNTFHYVGLGSGWARPGLFDLESKFVEGGISTIELAELKNFTHGRYISVYRHKQNRIAIIMRCPPYDDLVDFIKKKLEKKIKIIELSTDLPSIQGGIDLAIQALYLANHLGIRSGIDIAKPVYPKEARGLYSWKPRKSFNSEFMISQKKTN